MSLKRPRIRIPFERAGVTNSACRSSVVAMSLDAKKDAVTSTATVNKRIIALVGAMLLALGMVLSLGLVHVSDANAAGFNKHAYSTSKDGSLWQIVNKAHPFHKRSYKPKGLVKTKYTNGKYVKKTAVGDLGKMYRDAKKSDISLRTISAYRSYSYQKSLYNSYVKRHSKKAADRFSARPGYSEHQTGLAVDIGQKSGRCGLSNCFGKTKAGKWLHKHSWKYGFVLRYTKANSKKTGYMAEAWHFRYIGKSAAKTFRYSKATSLEAFFGVSGGAKYKK